MGNLAAAPLRLPGVKWYVALDTAWKRLLETGPKWFMDHVWHSCLYYVRASNAWPKPYEEPDER